eukprot:TRINITY_DN2849_c3_g1_i1.p1 TRINITY_DN2849_c3_g1~~TRINITY_DN2849_c3_g1_i1.p1  ORF type:complete len:431 (-),score=31.77 TRINITY_DN2849_c3_g1_i1:310-1602(-)
MYPYRKRTFCASARISANDCVMTLSRLVQILICVFATTATVSYCSKVHAESLSQHSSSEPSDEFRGANSRVLLQGRVKTMKSKPLQKGLQTGMLPDMILVAQVTINHKTYNVLHLLMSVVFTLTGASMTVIGFMVQKTAHSHKESTGSASLYFFSPRWIFGFLIFLSGNLLTWIALGYGPASTLACFNSWNIIFAVVVAPMFFGESVSVGSKLAAIMLVLACVWVTLAGPLPGVVLDVHAIGGLFRTPAFLACSAACSLVLVSGLVRHCYSDAFAAAQPRSTTADLHIIAVAAIFGSYAVLFSKCTSILIQEGGHMSGHAWDHWQLWLWIAAIVLCGISQIHFLNLALRRGDASFVIPAYEAIGILVQIVVGGIFFREYLAFTLGEHVRFWTGVAFVLLGLLALCGSTAESSTKGNDDRGAAQILTATGT